MLNILLVSSWRGFRVRVLKRLVKMGHRVSVLVEREPLPRLPLATTVMANIPKGAKMADVLWGPVFAEQVWLKKEAKKHGVLLHTTADINSGPSVDWIKKIGPDLIFTLAWDHKLGHEVLGVPTRGCVNLHPSLLPRYRGRYPISSAIYDGASETGITYHLMTETFDAGDILMQKRFALDGRESGLSMLRKCAQAVGESLAGLLEDFEGNRLTPHPQNETRATFSRKFTAEDAVIDWSKTSDQIDLKIRALFPWLVCHSFHQARRLEFAGAIPANAVTGVAPGQVLEIADDTIRVATGDGSLDLQIHRTGGLFNDDRSGAALKRLRMGDLLFSTSNCCVGG